jgi:hypothetical protein
MRQQIFLEGRAVHCFPCGTNKKPTTPHGFKDACADLAGIERLWRDRPGPLTGIRSGQLSGVSVIDVDPRRNGLAWYGVEAAIRTIRSGLGVGLYNVGHFFSLIGRRIER